MAFCLLGLPGRGTKPHGHRLAAVASAWQFEAKPEGLTCQELTQIWDK